MFGLRKKRSVRQSALFDDVAAFVEKRGELLMRDAVFLNDGMRADKPIAYFRRSEIHFGKLLGKGTFSNVYVVRQIVLSDRDGDLFSKEVEASRQACKRKLNEKNTGCRLVVKSINEQILMNSTKAFIEAATDLIREAAYLAKLDHRHIIKLKGMSVDGASALREGRHDSLFIVVEKLSETLDVRIQRWGKHENRPQLLDKCKYAYQIAEALQYLHERGIIFCDLKPKNIGFLDDEIKLFDFGLCVELSCGQQTGEDGLFSFQTSGTPRYSSPEMLNGREYNEKTDVYSWAMVFYEMLTHQKPFRKLSVEQLFEFISSGSRPSLSEKNFPKQIENLLCGAWEQNVSHRYSMKSVCTVLNSMLHLSERRSLKSKSGGSSVRKSPVSSVA